MLQARHEHTIPGSPFEILLAPQTLGTCDCTSQDADGNRTPPKKLYSLVPDEFLECLKACE